MLQLLFECYWLLDQDLSYKYWLELIFYHVQKYVIFSHMFGVSPSLHQYANFQDLYPYFLAYESM